MPNLNDLFPSKFLKAHDLQGHTPAVTIARVGVEAMGRTRETLPVVYFKGKAKGLKLNKTNAAAIADIAGSAQTEDWIGVAVTLYATVADFGGQTYPVVRVRAVVPAVAPVAGSRAPRALNAITRALPPRPPAPLDELDVDLQDRGGRS